MILPTKHTKFDQSLLGFGSCILQIIDQGATIDFIWNTYNKNSVTKQSFDNLLLSLVFLFSIGAIKEINGVIYKCN